MSFLLSPVKSNVSSVVNYKDTRVKNNLLKLPVFLQTACGCRQCSDVAVERLPVFGLSLWWCFSPAGLALCSYGCQARYVKFQIESLLQLLYQRERTERGSEFFCVKSMRTDLSVLAPSQYTWAKEFKGTNPFVVSSQKTGKVKDCL